MPRSMCRAPPLAGRERLSQHRRRVAARRVLAFAAAFSTSSRPTGTSRCASSSSAIPSNRSARFEVASAAQHWLARLGSTSPSCGATFNTATIWQATCRREAGFSSIEPAELTGRGRHYRQRAERPQDLHDTDDVLRAIYRFPSVTAVGGRGRLDGNDLPPEDRIRRALQRRHRQGPRRARHRRAWPGRVRRLPDRGRGRAARRGFSTRRSSPRPAGCTFRSARLHAGFRLVTERIVLVSGGELFHRTDLTRPTRRRLGRVIDSFLELREGDFVVHLAHGIGRYRGLKLLEKARAGRRAPGDRVRTAARRSSCRRPRSTWCRSTSAAAKAGRRWPKSAAKRGSSRKQRPKRRSSIWPSRCWSCRPRASRGRASPSPTTRSGSASSTPSFPYRETPDQLAAIDVDQGRHAAAAADGPAALRRRRLRQDRSGDAGRVQGGR